MELTLQTRPLSWLQCVQREVRRQEETAEAIVPDSWPDIGTIVDAHAAVYLRGKELREGSVSLSGGIRGSVLYLPETGGSPRNLEYALPFTVKVENPALTESSQVLCDLKAAAVDGKMINSRKALLRVDVSCAVTVFEMQEQLLTKLENQPARLRIRKRSYDLDLPLETAERSFAISDTLEFPADQDAMWGLCRLRCGLEITDRKLVGSKAVFRGNVLGFLLYQTEDGRLCSREFRLPFSQYCDLKQDYDQDEQLQILPVVTGCELEPETSTAASRAYLNLHVLVQCLVHGKRRLELLEDAYAINGSLQPRWSEFAPEATLDHLQTTKTLRTQLPEPLHQVLDTAVYAAHPACSRTEEGIQLRAPVSVHVLGYDRDGVLRGAAASDAALWELPLWEQASCTPSSSLSGQPFVSSAGGGTEVRTELELQAQCTGVQSLRTLSGGTLEEQARRPEAPSVILRRASRGADLWSIAKAAGANEELLRLANGLEDDRVPDDRVLLIPVG